MILVFRMSPRKAIKLLIFFSSLKIFHCIEIKCEPKYETNFPDKQTVFTCELQPLKINSKTENISSCVSIEPNKVSSCENFETFKAKQGKSEILYLPKNLNEYFPRLKYLIVESCRLKEIHKNDLKNFPDLQGVSFNNNLLESLKKNLFDFNPNLTSIFMSNNRILFIHRNVFDNLKNLKFLTLLGNDCINYATTNFNLMEVKEKIKNCGWRNSEKLFESSEEKFEDPTTNLKSVETNLMTKDESSEIPKEGKSKKF